MHIFLPTLEGQGDEPEAAEIQVGNIEQTQEFLHEMYYEIYQGMSDESA